jgi:nucleoside-diphosphate-sugar epimerase
VKDCVEGPILAMMKIENAEPINLGSNEVISIEDLAKKILAISDKKIEIEYDLSDPRGTNKYCADTTKMRKTLGWEPKTPLDIGLKKTYEWAKRKLLESG